MRKLLAFLLLLSLCFSENAPLESESDIAQYLKLEIKEKNPFENFKPFGDRFGIPLPSLNSDEVVVNDFQVKEQSSINGDFNFEKDSLLNTYILDSGFNHISTLLSDYIKEILRDNNQEDIINIEVNLSGVVTHEESGLGGDVNLLYRVHKDKVNTLELLGGINRDPASQIWSGNYGVQHRIQHQSLEKIYFQQSLIKNDDLIDESTWKYGIGYSPFENFTTYIERENNTGSEDSTKAGVRYKITF
ncbi:hypothetical protein LS70_001690 [Helicobacter sp. MIT 11-5569]|uniref:hypothetical protein n=1 Tax=Helicobacter sp. MIT 11-5569 TaxID=1548151 RepID=UPI0010FF293E|nr:hypothetical protein [Helicobacter sp. MIT 11-5569]TLD85286.1 hypothetical protein LS70_001690 [Helicobacter sp. MIT 11-5569]